jgi:hypothetical protein
MIEEEEEREREMITDLAHVAAGKRKFRFDRCSLLQARHVLKIWGGAAAAMNDDAGCGPTNVTADGDDDVPLEALTVCTS